MINIIFTFTIITMMNHIEGELQEQDTTTETYNKRFGRGYPSNMGSWNTRHSISSYGWEKQQPIDLCDYCAQRHDRHPQSQSQSQFQQPSPMTYESTHSEYRGNGYDNLTPRSNIKNDHNNNYPEKQWILISSSSYGDNNPLQRKHDNTDIEQRRWDNQQQIYPVDVYRTSKDDKRSDNLGVVPIWLGGKNMWDEKYNNDGYDVSSGNWGSQRGREHDVAKGYKSYTSGYIQIPSYKNSARDYGHTYEHNHNNNNNNNYYPTSGVIHNYLPTDIQSGRKRIIYYDYLDDTKPKNTYQIKGCVYGCTWRVPIQYINRIPAIPISGTNYYNVMQSHDYSQQQNQNNFQGYKYTSPATVDNRHNNFHHNSYPSKNYQDDSQQHYQREKGQYLENNERNALGSRGYMENYGSYDFYGKSIGHDNIINKDQILSGFKPWDQTTKGVSGWDTNGIGHYLASKKDNVNSDRGYASNWHYEENPQRKYYDGNYRTVLISNSNPNSKYANKDSDENLSTQHRIHTSNNLDQSTIRSQWYSTNNKIGNDNNVIIHHNGHSGIGATTEFGFPYKKPSKYTERAISTVDDILETTTVIPAFASAEEFDGKIQSS